MPSRTAEQKFWMARALQTLETKLDFLDHLSVAHSLDLPATNHFYEEMIISSITSNTPCTLNDPITAKEIEKRLLTSKSNAVVRDPEKF